MTEDRTLDQPRTRADRASIASDAVAPPAPSPSIPARLPDAELLRRIQADDLDAFGLLFERYQVLIHRTAYGLTGDAQVAEEILQDTFERAWRHRGSLQLDRSPVPWLHRVALNLCYSRLARRRLPTEAISDAAHDVRDVALEPADQVERDELRQTIRIGVAALPPKHQSVIVLYYLHGMSLQETSDALGVALGTVKSRLHYALGALRGHLAAERRVASGGAAGAPLTLAPTPLPARAPREGRPRC